MSEVPEKVHEIHGKGSMVGKRLDLAMIESVKSMSRRKAKSLIDAGAVFINGKKVRIASRQVEHGDRVQWRDETNECP